MKKTDKKKTTRGSSKNKFLGLSKKELVCCVVVLLLLMQVEKVLLSFQKVEYSISFDSLAKNRTLFPTSFGGRL